MSTAMENADIGDPLPRSVHKLASQVADRIVRDITADGWKVGTVIGSEVDLLERYEVSRAVFRESIRLLEHLGVATTRRGPGGGLVVSAPSTTAVVQAFMVYLTFAGMSVGELMEARISLERSIARLAVEKAQEDQISALRARVGFDLQRVRLSGSDHHMLHRMIGTASGNPAAELFIDVLGRLTARWSYPVITADAREAALTASANAHAGIVDAITSGNAALAERRMSNHLGALADYLGRQRMSPRGLDWVLDDSSGEEKLGSRVARSIIIEIVERNWPIGAVIGSEPDLIERYDVSRSALREAVRLLEYHEVAVMKRGPGGGLVVTTPSIDPIVRAATVYLEFRGMSAADLMAMRRDLESDAVALVAQHARDADIEGLRAATASDAALGFEGPIERELHAQIAKLTGNPAITLFMQVLVNLTRVHGAAIPGRRSPQRAAINAESAHAHSAIVEALIARDVPLARRRMTKHLTAMEPLLR